MALETTIFEALLTVAVAAGVIWVFAWSVPILLAQSKLAAYGRSAPFLQLVVFVGGLALVGRVAGADGVLGTAAVLALVWCGSVLRETYLRALHHTPLMPDPIPEASAQPSTGSQRDAASARNESNAAGMKPTDLVGTVTTLISTHSLPPEQFTVSTAPEKTDGQRGQAQSPASAGTLAAWIDLTQMPNRPLSKRPTLGKQTIASLQLRERK